MKEKNCPNGRIISIRLLAEEAESLKVKAAEAHMSKAQFLKNVIIHGGAYRRTNFTRGYRDKLMYEVERIGNNLNQINFRAYGSESIDEIECLRLRDYYLDLLSAFSDFLQEYEEKNTNY